MVPLEPSGVLYHAVIVSTVNTDGRESDNLPFGYSW